MCLIEPLNSRITAPNYFLSNLHSGEYTVKHFIAQIPVLHAINCYVITETKAVY